MRSLNDPPVKEVRDARPCLACGRPTWSRAQVCVPCKWRGILIGPRREPRGGTELERMRSVLPVGVRYALESRLFRQRYGIPQGLIALAMWIGCFVVLVVIMWVLMGLIAFATLSVEPRLGEVVFAAGCCGSILIPLLGSVFLTNHIMMRLSRRVLDGVLSMRDGGVLVHQCPACSHDQRGTVSDVCPECGARVVFPMG